jgi:hypothetical protein
MTQHEENCWIEAGLRSDGVELGVFEKGAIVHYGRLLTKDLVQAGRNARGENFDLRLENSALRAMIEALKDQIQK